MEKDNLERICLNCNQFFPATMGEATEFGICLNDKAFEPFIEELLENTNYTSCQDLINRKKFSGEQEACADFEQVEYVEVDDDSPLGQELSRLRETGKFNSESLKEALLEEQIRNIDLGKISVEQYVKKLKGSHTEEQRSAITSLGSLISFGNREAFEELFKFFQQLPPPKTIDEVHLKKMVLKYLERHETTTHLIPHLIDELYNTPSNNTTRQWITDIFRFLKNSSHELVREPLQKMLKDKRFSYRLKQKIKDILYE